MPVFRETFVIFYVTAIICFASELKLPTVQISILVRNKAHTLPYFLTLLEQQNYPKDRISLWISSDHNFDNSIEILRKWLSSTVEEYHSAAIKYEEEDANYPGEKNFAHWTQARFNYVIKLRESAINHARKIWADYLWMLDADAFITNPDTLRSLIAKNLSVSAPMLKSDGLYSNFWYGMTDDYYYERTEYYEPVLNREKIGCFAVPMIHSSVLIDLRRADSDLLTYVPSEVDNYQGPDDDIITFAIAARSNGIDLHVCNDVKYGFIMVPLEPEDTMEQDLKQLTNLKLEILNENPPLRASALLQSYTKKLPEKDTLGFDEIYMINLLRRPERRERMNWCFDELGLSVKAIDAVDGRSLSESYLDGIVFLPNYADPYHKRPMTLGEIGCFMSHYNVWQDIVSNGHQVSLVLEDDIRFEPFFRGKVLNLMVEVRRLPDWDLIYFGRKRLLESKEPALPNSKYLVEVSYSYWTLGYILSNSGARKLLEAEPLKKLVPVDEYFPILFDKHPQMEWKTHFQHRNLIAYSASPLLLYPTHYTGEKGYISDTEDSIVIKEASSRDDL